MVWYAVEVSHLISHLEATLLMARPHFARLDMHARTVDMHVCVQPRLGVTGDGGRRPKSPSLQEEERPVSRDLSTSESSIFKEG